VQPETVAVFHKACPYAAPHDHPLAQPGGAAVRKPGPCAHCDEPAVSGGYCAACHAAYMREWRARRAETERWIGGIAFALAALNDRKAKRKSRKISRETIFKALNKALKV
jgi:hypothetical protein